MSKRDFRLAQIHQQNQKPKTQPIPNPPKPPVRSRSLSPGKTVKKQTKKLSFQELYLKGIGANSANNENSKNANNNTNNDTKTTKLKTKKIIDDTNTTPNTKNVNMNIFKAAKFRSNELLAIKEFKPNRKDRFSGGPTVFLG